MMPKNAVFKAFERKNLEFPLATLFGNGLWTIRYHKQQFGDLLSEPEAYAELIIETQSELKSPIVFVGSGYNNYLVAVVGAKIEEQGLGPPDIIEHVIKQSAEEVISIDPAVIDDNPVIRNIRQATQLVGEVIGDEYVVTSTSWGPFTLAGQLFGVEAYMKAIFKRPNEVEKTLHFASKLIKQFFRPLIEGGHVRVISLSEPTASGDLVSGSIFRRFALPYLQSIIEWIHGYGVYVWLHICGDTTASLVAIAETRADCFSLDHKVDLAVAKATIGDKICLAGNINPVTMAMGAPGDVRRMGQDCLEAMRGGTVGFILTTGCDLPPGVPIENLKALLDLGRVPE